MPGQYVIIHPDAGWRNRVFSSMRTGKHRCSGFNSWSAAEFHLRASKPDGLLLYVPPEEQEQAVHRLTEMKRAESMSQVFVVVDAGDQYIRRAMMGLGVMACVDADWSADRIVACMTAFLAEPAPLQLGDSAGQAHQVQTAPEHSRCSAVFQDEGAIVDQGLTIRLADETSLRWPMAGTWGGAERLEVGDHFRELAYGLSGVDVDADCTSASALDQAAKMQWEAVQALVAAAEAREMFASCHGTKVSGYAEAICAELGMEPAQSRMIKLAALLHDVGKIGVPDAILCKPGPLTDDEFCEVRRHPAMALDILQNLTFLRDALPSILHHHERYDGMGYPHGLSGNQIPIGARIIAVADAMDVMLTSRCYKHPFDQRTACGELRRSAGSQFDPKVVDALLRSIGRSRAESMAAC